MKADAVAGGSPLLSMTKVAPSLRTTLMMEIFMWVKEVLPDAAAMPVTLIFSVENRCKVTFETSITPQYESKVVFEKAGSVVLVMLHEPAARHSEAARRRHVTKSAICIIMFKLHSNF